MVNSSGRSSGEPLGVLVGVAVTVPAPPAAARPPRRP